MKSYLYLIIGIGISIVPEELLEEFKAEHLIAGNEIKLVLESEDPEELLDKVTELLIMNTLGISLVDTLEKRSKNPIVQTNMDIEISLN